MKYRLVRETHRRDYQLTVAQRQVANHRHGGLVVLGGSRTGKTVALVEAAVGALAEDVPQVVFLVANRRTRMNLQSRVGSAFPELSSRFMVNTIHGLCLSLVRNQVDPGLGVLNSGEQDHFLSTILAQQGDDGWPPEFDQLKTTREFTSYLRETLGRFQKAGILPETILSHPEIDRRPAWVSFAGFYQLYRDRLAAESKLDYGGLLHEAQSFLARRDLRQTLRADGSMVIVDDCEDFDSPAQLLDGLIGDTCSFIFSMNPDCQANEFRGARLRSINEMLSAVKTSQRPTSVVTLNQGFHVTHEVELACQPHRQLMSLPAIGADFLASYRQITTDSHGQVTKYRVADRDTHSELCARLLREAHLRDKIPYDQMAVVVRTKTHVAQLARTCESAGIPVRLADEEIQLNGEPVVIQLLGALQLVGPPGQYTHHLPVTSQSLLKVVEEMTNNGVTLSGTDVEMALWNLWSRWEEPEQWEEASRDSGPSGLIAHRILDAVMALFSLASTYSSLPLEAGIKSVVEAVLSADIPENLPRVGSSVVPAVRITTPHRAKGKTWSLVIMAFLQEGVWPSRRSDADLIDVKRFFFDEVSELERIDSERKLLYATCAATTRDLVVTCVDNDEDQPSMFFSQIVAPEMMVESSNQPLGTAGELIARLKQVLVNETSHPALRSAAASHLGLMSAQEIFRGADPSRWWGISYESQTSGDIHDVGAVSASTIETLLDCPRRWYLETQFSVRPSGVQMTMGTLLHEIIQDSSMDHDQRMAVLSDRFQEVEFPAPWQAKVGLEAAEQSLVRYDLWMKSRNRQVIASEVPVTLRWDTHGVVRGRIDRVEKDEQGNIWIVDFKTGAGFSRMTVKEAKANIQLGIYQRAISEGGIDRLNRGVTIGGAELVGLGCDGSKKYPGPKVIVQDPLHRAPHLDQDITVGVVAADVVPQVGDQYQWPTWVDHRLNLVSALTKCGQYPAIPGPRCRFCPVSRGCPAAKEGQQ
ncbi:MAG: PD-(D/E)XK nuclease family protein [Propionibacteriaceae bacterium]|nr:PD-(D/E)XK nuclease family protein [Propionibacteriaceae bacterium]